MEHAYMVNGRVLIDLVHIFLHIMQKKHLDITQYVDQNYSFKMYKNTYGTPFHPLPYEL
jgi:hypothetical protein